MRSVAIILAALLMGTTAHAVDSNGRFHIVGAGAVTCQQYTDATEQQRIYAETWWAGYITALNRATGDTYNIMGDTTAQAVNGMIAKYCADNPEMRLALAIHKVIEYLQPNRIRKSPN
jgi:hypothetical protein